MGVVEVYTVEDLLNLNSTLDDGGTMMLMSDLDFDGYDIRQGVLNLTRRPLGVTLDFNNKSLVNLDYNFIGTGILGNGNGQGVFLNTSSDVTILNLGRLDVKVRTRGNCWIFYANKVVVDNVNLNIDVVCAGYHTFYASVDGIDNRVSNSKMNLRVRSGDSTFAVGYQMRYLENSSLVLYASGTGNRIEVGVRFAISKCVLDIQISNPGNVYFLNNCFNVNNILIDYNVLCDGACALVGVTDTNTVSKVVMDKVVLRGRIDARSSYGLFYSNTSTTSELTNCVVSNNIEVFGSTGYSFAYIARASSFSFPPSNCYRSDLCELNGSVFSGTNATAGAVDGSIVVGVELGNAPFYRDILGFEFA